MICFTFYFWYLFVIYSFAFIYSCCHLLNADCLKCWVLAAMHYILYRQLVLQLNTDLINVTTRLCGESLLSGNLHAYSRTVSETLS